MAGHPKKTQPGIEPRTSRPVIRETQSGLEPLFSGVRGLRSGGVKRVRALENLMGAPVTIESGHPDGEHLVGVDTGVQGF